jgi:hypothetical protein
MSKIRHQDPHRGSCIILSHDKEHPVSSKLCQDGRLEQMGLSWEGFQREVGVHRTTEKDQFCWSLDFYQHPGNRRSVPLACTTRETQTPPAEVLQMARAFHKLAESGVDPREDGGRGNPRGKSWHRFVVPALMGEPTKKSVEKHLKEEGLWPRSGDFPVTDVTKDLGRKRARSRRKARR